jgi:outer membrane protein OmpA-like peptidoglycan-associated protein
MPSHEVPASLPSAFVTAVLRGLSLALGVCAANPAIAQVTYFHRPPTVDQLRDALLSPAVQPPAMPTAAGTEALPPGTRTRGIVLDPDEAPRDAPGARPGAAAAAAILAERARIAAPAVGARAAALPINFDFGSSRVDRDSLPYIERIASLMRNDPGLQLVVEGHTDERGSFTRNMVLSWERAIGVYRALVEGYGVDPTRLQLLGKGPLEPLPGTEPRDGSNRRVQFRVPRS